MSTTLRTHDKKIFAEGLAEIGGRMVQLTYKEKIAFVLSGDPSTDLTLAQPGEGWGLTALNGELVKSDGSARLTFLNPTTLTVKRSLGVHEGSKDLLLLNELEAARGMILANVFTQDFVAMINPANGCVFGKIDLSALRAEALRDTSDAKCDGASCVRDDFATNGIAYDNVKDELYFTGKNWPFIFVFKFPQ
jgi:glutamine cyclotransferase